MRDARLASLLDRYRQRFLLASMSWGVVIASAVAGMLTVTIALTTASDGAMRLGIVATFIAIAGVLAWRMARRWTASRTAREIEARSGGLDNLVVTAEEIASARLRAPHPVVNDELFAGALARLEALPLEQVQPLGRALGAAALSMLAVGALLLSPPRLATFSDSPSAPKPANDSIALISGELRVIVTPPAYAGGRASESLNPTSVTALEGSRIQFEMPLDDRERAASSPSVSLQEPDGRTTPFEGDGSTARLEITATTSRPIVVRRTGPNGTVVDHLVHLRITRDEPPAVAIREPARDLIFAEGKGQVPLQIEARDDLGLQSLSLRYTRVSGSGETFTFEEGEWPLELVREGAASWRARGVFTLEQLKLQDGDTLVYRAIARDAKPGADPSASDSYLIEIGRLAGVASQGFALPEERDRQAISQQMLIIKTERLHADRNSLSTDAFTEQAQLLAIEQRMVKAEFVFMTGGDVQDEMEEAAHSHELAEGRMENAAQVDLLAAIREMSRAEARLNAADTAQALEFERAALKALQRAFDRRRYLLRTLPERTRIDVSRRLTGELDTAQSSTLRVDERSAETAEFLQRARGLLADLAGAAGESHNLTLLASRALALAPESEELQTAALTLTSARDTPSQAAALRSIEQAIISLLRQGLAGPSLTPLERNPLTGRLVQELRSPQGSP